jgi:hypothetical protein
MNLRNRIGAYAGSIGILMLAGACNPDLDVTNQNQPDVERALASGSDVRSLIGSSYNTVYQAMQGLTDNEPLPGLATHVMADNMTMAYGNFGARFNGQEPRLAFNNSSAAADGRVASTPYDAIYGALGAANDGLNAIKRGITPRTGKSAPDETPQMEAFAFLVQGMALGYEALVFDQGFVVDEDTPLGAAVLEDYPAISAAALTKFDKAIAAAQGQSWTVATEFTPGMTYTASRLDRVANTMAARQLAYLPRTAAENATVDWARVLAYADKGISTGTPFDMQITGDGGNTWGDTFKAYGELESWVRVDQRVVQLADPSQPVVYASVNPPPRANPADLRWAHGSPDANGNVKQAGADFWFINDIPYDPARGVYFFSQWQHARYITHSYEFDDYMQTTVPYVLAAENDLLIAEALVRTGGDKARAATLINKTRVTRGGLPALSGGSSNNDLLAAIFYERDVELFDTGAGQAWFDRRRIDLNLTYNGLPIGNTWAFRGGSNLQKGTPRHLPLPAKELETLGLPVYTYGGASPNPVFPEM